MNPSVDLFVEADELVDNSKTRCRPLELDPGGGGINVARNLHRFGLDVEAVLTAGGANGERLRELLEHESFSCHLIDIREETRQSLAVTEKATGKLYHLVLPGPRLQASEWQRALECLNTLAPTPDYLVLTGSLPDGAPDDFYGRVASTAVQRGTRIILDTSGRALMPSMKQGIYLAKLNFDEFVELGYAGTRDVGSMLSAMEDMVREGRVDNLIVTLDADGALLATSTGDRLHARPPPTEVVSHVGAGDGFVSVLTFKLQQGESVVEAFRYGVAAAAAKVNTPGNQLHSLDKVERIYPRVELL